MMFNPQYWPQTNVNQNNYRIRLFHRHLDQLIYNHYLIHGGQKDYVEIETIINSDYQYHIKFLNQFNLVYSLINYWLKSDKNQFLTLNQINLITIILDCVPILNYPKSININQYWDWIINSLINGLINFDYLLIILNYFLIKNNLASLFSFDNWSQINHLQRLIKSGDKLKIKQIIKQHFFDYKAKDKGENDGKI